jgi:hypothetical protein
MIARLKNILILFAVFAPIFSACDLPHEFPDDVFDGDAVRKLSLKLDFDTLMSLIDHTYPVTRDIDAYQLQYTIRAFEGDSLSYSRQHTFEYVFTRQWNDTLDASFDILIPNGNWKFFAWTEFVQIGASGTKFHKIDDFASIELIWDGDDYPANTDYRDAFRGEANIAMIESADSLYFATATPDTIAFSMKRPLAKFQFISTDLDKFISSRAEVRASRGEGSRDLYPTFRAEEYGITFRYNGYMPFAYNMFTNRPADSTTGVSFSGAISRLSDSEALIGYDYIFVNGSSTFTSISIEVYDLLYNELIATAGPIEVPLLRSNLTTVRGEFLTAPTSGGVGIRPGFDGDFNLEIH